MLRTRASSGLRSERTMEGRVTGGPVLPCTGTSRGTRHLHKDCTLHYRVICFNHLLHCTLHTYSSVTCEQLRASPGWRATRARTGQAALPGPPAGGRRAALHLGTANYRVHGILHYYTRPTCVLEHTSGKQSMASPLLPLRLNGLRQA